MALLAIFVTAIIIIMGAVLVIQLSAWFEKRKIDKEACERFRKFYIIHQETYAEMHKIFYNANPQTKEAIKKNFDIRFMKGGEYDAEGRNSNRSISLRF